MAENRVGEPHSQFFSSLLAQHDQGHNFFNKNINFVPPYLNDQVTNILEKAS